MYISHTIFYDSVKEIPTTQRRAYMNRELEHLLFLQQEEESFHLPLEDEFHFYRSIQQGDLSVLEGHMEIEPLEGLGTLSTNPMRNKKYHLIILVAMMTRFCVEGGLDMETAYTMSDMFIRHIDQADTPQELSQIKRDAITQYTTAMHQRKKQQPLSLPVVRAMEYIRTHLTLPLTNKEIAAAVSCHPDYLSRLFKQETNSTLSRYVLEQKCHTAKYMLENSSASCTRIGAFLGFSSCSHFISRFKSVEHMTPEEYRKLKQRQPLSSYDTTSQ